MTAIVIVSLLGAALLLFLVLRNRKDLKELEKQNDPVEETRTEQSTDRDQQ